MGGLKKILRKLDDVRNLNFGSGSTFGLTKGISKGLNEGISKGLNAGGTDATGPSVVTNPEYDWTQDLLRKQADYYSKSIDEMSAGRSPFYGQQWEDYKAGKVSPLYAQQWADYQAGKTPGYIDAWAAAAANQSKEANRRTYFGQEGRRGEGVVEQMRGVGAAAGLGAPQQVAQANKAFQDYVSREREIDDYISELKGNYTQQERQNVLSAVSGERNAMLTAVNAERQMMLGGAASQPTGPATTVFPGQPGSPGWLEQLLPTIGTAIGAGLGGPVGAGIGTAIGSGLGSRQQQANLAMFTNRYGNANYQTRQPTENNMKTRWL